MTTTTTLEQPRVATRAEPEGSIAGSVDSVDRRSTYR
jgi:hypothetical protein